MNCVEKALPALDGFTDRTAEWVDEYLAGRKKGNAMDPGKTNGVARVCASDIPEREA